jgi:hypothetical protein
MSSSDRLMLLGAARRALEPSALDRARNAHALAARLGVAVGSSAAHPGTTPDVGAAAGSKAAGGSAMKGALAGKALLGLKLVGALAVIGGAATVAVDRSPRASTPSTPARISSVAPPQLSVSVSVQPPMPTASSFQPVSPPRDGRSTSGRTTTLAHPAPAAGAVHSSNPPSTRGASSPRVAEEIALVRAIHAALADQDPGRATSLADDYGRKYPDGGALGLEVAGLRVVARCQAERGSSSARASAREFASRHPRTPIVDRVRAACGTD